MHIYGYESRTVLYPTLFAVLSLTPAILIAPLVRIQAKTPVSVVEFVNIYSVVAAIIAGVIIFIEFIQTLDFSFAFLVLPGFLVVLWVYLGKVRAENRGTLMRFGTMLVSV